jgi:site-specific DNA-cytosine methylase
MTTPRAVDVLGFAGGFTLGMVQAGFELVGKRELKGGFGVANCEANRALLGDAWRTEACDPEAWSVVDAEVVFGNPPCSGFSVMSSKEFRGADSKINHCMWSFADYVSRVRPVAAVFESVQQAHTRPDGLDLMRRLRSRVEERSGLTYTLHHVLHNAYSVGGCAQRPRYFWVISQVPFGVEWPDLPRDDMPTLEDAIGDLQPLTETWSPQPYATLPSAWAGWRTSATSRVDGHMSVSNPLTGRIKDLLIGIEWRQGEHIAQVVRRHYETHGQLPWSWRSTQDKLVKQDFFMGFTTPVRWRANTAARVITGGGLVMAVHPWLPRTLTHREVARIMGFVDDWKIEPLQRHPGLTMTWGKGITVDCGRWIGGWIKNALEGSPGSHVGVQIGEREFKIDVTNAWKQDTPDRVKMSSKTPRQRELSPMRGNTVTEPTEATETAPKRGRGNSPAIAARDEAVFEALTEATTREAVAARHELTTAEAYLSLDRLRRAGRVASERRDGKFVWYRPDLPAPVPTDA